MSFLPCLARLLRSLLCSLVLRGLESFCSVWFAQFSFFGGLRGSFTETLTAISPLNKTDVLTLASAFGNVKNILLASRQALERCPGIGEKKARRILKVVRQPFFSPLSSASASAHFATSASSSPPSSSDSSLSSAPALPPPLSSPLCIRDDAS
uniref:DNA repair protein rad10 subfamily protein n=1 Tax=Toxoplasma gondii COUG TaxID=1074873 RepID=A0A2G8YB49_TOXGO|nr:DNA repair protein rad10 subfamily protein [Toxoplasma gondii COUG]